MNHDFTFAVVGGDMRQSCLVSCLLEEKRRVHALCMEKNESIADKLPLCESFQMILPQCDAVIFPLPISTDSLTLNAPFCALSPLVSEVFRYIPPNAAVFGGMINERIHDMAELAGIEISDYYQREELIVKNCIPTAEGALAIAMQETAKTIFGMNCLVTGYGRVGKAMCKLLLACGANVTVAARKQSDLAWISMAGAKPVEMKNLTNIACGYDVIFNTVPVKLFGEEILGNLKKESIIIDLASKPGGAYIIF